MNRKQHNTEAGYVAERMNPFVPGTKVTIYDAAKQGIDTGGTRFAVVCDAHATIIGETSLPLARASMKNPSNFCEQCRSVVLILKEVAT